MSLIAWYPLDGDTIDYSGNYNNLITSTSTQFVDGKIGQALGSGGLYWAPETTNKILNNNALTISLWIYVGGTTGSTTERAMIFGNGGMSANNNRKFTIFQYPTCNDLHLSWMNDDASTVFLGNQLNGALPSGKWTHLCITYKNPTANVYINGILVDTRSGVSSSSTFSYQTQVVYDSSFHRLNDYRFYDHALSTKEIKELAKAKILHYTFNDFQEPTTNLISNSVMVRTNQPNITGGTDGVGDYFIKSDDSTWWAGINPNNTFINSDTFYTWSFEIMCDIAMAVSWDANISPGPNGNDNYTNIVNSTSYTTPNAWQKVYQTCKSSSGLSSPYLHSSFTTRDANAFGKKIYYRNAQIESKPYFTDYTMTSNPRLGAVNDSSGYENNATLTETTTPQWTTSSKGGSGGYNFTGLNKYIDTGVKLFSTSNPVQEFTLSAWIYPANNSFENWVVDQYNYSTNRFIWFRATSQKMRYFYNGSTILDSASIVPTNTWSHVSVTRDSLGNIRMYLNGILDGSGTHTGVIANINTHVGSYYSTYTPTYSLDDVRMYATALSSSDVLEMVNTKAQLDNVGNLFLSEVAYEFPKSAYEIKLKYPNAKSGIYTIQPNLDIAPFLAYCDMTTDGGGWTLILCSQSQLASQWDAKSLLYKNQDVPSIVSDYSILGLADSIKTNIGGKLQYRIDAESFGRWGGTWEAPITNTFTAYNTVQPNGVNLTKYDVWNIETRTTTNSSLSNKMPWIKLNSDQLLSTWNNTGNWYGTLVTNSTSWNPAPYISPQKVNPGIIWYWVK